jgi:DNA-directed RNA polymerase specialized sigma24 family protein
MSTGRTDSVQAEAMLERARLVRLCTRLTGNVDVAEDLAQETLFEAWRHSYKLREPEGRDRWLSAVARTVCRRWARDQGRELGTGSRRAFPSHLGPSPSVVPPVTPIPT